MSNNGVRAGHFSMEYSRVGVRSRRGKRGIYPEFCTGMIRLKIKKIKSVRRKKY